MGFAPSHQSINSKKKPDVIFEILEVKIVKNRLAVEMCIGMGFPMGPGIPWESHRNGNKTELEMGGNGKPPQWEWELPALPWY